ncbi:hypothetical protein [Aliiglaciecola sp. LCG003]|uniref:hypothetical protein n=1 Tax=Aliiglaciecola sp. LCG003 TaxID=3053655 RepID=UPI002574843E|nr:hypothetical protein [Aliiglaciecola sp. LCG003]WJG09932.1 hypothetical protein QR722_02530 [Aliiglaciecola sp. LCG003]
MRKLFSLFFVLTVGTVAHAQADQQNAFDCMDKASFEINSQCMANSISQNIDYKNVQIDIANRASLQSDSVMATIKFYPKDMLIEVVAHRDALSDSNLSAAVKN